MSQNAKTRRSWAIGAAILTALSLVAYNITGWVKDDEGELLPQATIRILTPDSTFVKGVTTDTNGRFRLTGVGNGKYIIETTYVGLKPATRDITVKGSNLQLETIAMENSSLMLSEVSVRGVRTSVKVMEDTVQFDAGAYKTQPNAVVEDLLKRLPGVEVGTDGSITSNGKTVTKILLDGKEFFADDPKVASKNLPVDMVDKVQVVDRKSDLARMTGVDDGEDETVINLTVKKNMKNGWFGSAEGGYGTDDRYKGSFNINRMQNDNQFTLLGNFNNVNEEGFTDSNGNRFRRFGGTNGINTNQAIGANFNVGNKEIFRIGGNVMYSHTDRKSITDLEREYLFPDSAAYLTRHTESNDKGHNFRVDLRMKWQPDSFNTLEFRPNISLNYNDSWSLDSALTRDGHLANVNRNYETDKSAGHSFEGGASLTYNHNFRQHRGRSFSIHARYSRSNVRESSDNYYYTFFWRRVPYLMSDSIDIMDQVEKNHTWNNMVMTRVTWTEPLGNVKNGNFLNFSYRLQYRWNNADKLTYDHPVTWPDGFGGEPVIDYGQLVLNDSLSNQFRNDYFNQEISAGFKKVNKIYTLDVGVGVTPQMSKSEDLIITERNIPARWVWNVAPYVRYRHKFSKTSSLHANYNGRASQPSISQLQPVADISDPLHIKVGNPGLDPSFTHNIMARYQNFNMESQRSVMLMAFVNVTQNSIVSKTTFDRSTGVQTTTYTNVNGVWSGRLMNMYSQPLGNRNWTITNHLMVGYNQRVGFSNGLRNRSAQTDINEMFGIAFRPENFEIELRPYYRFSTTHNTVQTVNSTNVQSFGGTMNLTAYLPLGFVIASDLSYTGTTGYAAGYNRKEWMWNASLSWQTLRDKSLTFSLKAYDLLQQRSNISRSVTANYIDDSRFNTLTRYFMATVAWRFNTFGGRKPAGAMDGPGGHGPGRMGPPPGGGRGRGRF